MEELKVHDEPIINGMKYLFPKYSHEPFYLFTLFFRGGDKLWGLDGKHVISWVATQQYVVTY